MGGGGFAEESTHDLRKEISAGIFESPLVTIVVYSED